MIHFLRQQHLNKDFLQRFLAVGYPKYPCHPCPPWMKKFRALRVLRGLFRVPSVRHNNLK